MTEPRREPIAIVGIGCRFPGGVTTVDGLWRTLSSGKDVVSDIPPDRFDPDVFCDDDPLKSGTIRSNKLGVIDDIEAFDAEFFGFYPAEASRMDPQQRLVLEASVHALEDSGTPLEKASGSKTSVFVGTCTCDHANIQTAPEQWDNMSGHVATGMAVYSVANRVSHRLNLHAPSVTLDTACSSSLTAIHMACQSLWTRESICALAGGVNVILRPEPSMALSAAGFLSSDGACKPFDAEGNGYVRSEGVGIVYLKPLSQAVRDNDRVYACIRGSLVNQDGYTPEGITVPSLSAQINLLESVYAQCGVDPAKVSYVEAHGPGTRVGDPIEAKALGTHLGQRRSEDMDLLRIGSLKGNFGHMEGAAGIAAFIKAVLVTYYGEIPPVLNHKTPNPSIDFEALRLTVPTKAVSLHDQEDKRWVGVNSFGAGGTNAHVILEEHAQDVDSSLPSKHGPRVFVISARSAAALHQISKNLAVHLRLQEPCLEDVAYTLNMRRSRHACIGIIAATNRNNLCDGLDILRSGKVSAKSMILTKTSHTAPKAAFIFSGQGGQWLGMGDALAEQDSVFREALAEFDKIFSPLAGFSIREQISGQGKEDSNLNQTAVVQPAIAAIQIALARMFLAYGITPSAVVGHSIGEIAAAHIAGALSLEDAVMVIYARSQIQSTAAGKGSMLAIGMSATEADQLIKTYELEANVEVAALNGLKMTTLTGDIASLERVASELEQSGLFARFVNVDTPYHSHFMDPLERDLIEALSSVMGAKASIDLYSTVTTHVEPGTHLTGRYWFENIRKPVRYVETVTRMLEDGYNFLVEIGPHPVLVSGTRGIAEATPHAADILPAMVRGNDIDPASCVIGAAYAVGLGADISLFNGGGGSVIDLPLYPFQREKFWYEHPAVKRTRVGKSIHPFLSDTVSLTDDGRGILHLRLNTGHSPFLADHAIDGAIVFPMTGHLEVAYLATKLLGGHDKVWLEDVRLQHPLLLPGPEDFPPQVMLEITSPAKDFVISFRPANAAQTATWQTSSQGRINAFDKVPDTDYEDLEGVRSRMQTGAEVDISQFYTTLEESGFQYGELFRGIRKMWRLGEEIFSFISLPHTLDKQATRFRMHPALLDCAVHSAFAYLQYYADRTQVYVPKQVDRVHIAEAQGTTTIYAHVSICRVGNTSFRCSLTVYSDNGQILATLGGLMFRRLQGEDLRRRVEYRVSFEKEMEDSSNTIEPKGFQNVVVLHPGTSDNKWLLPAVRDALPHAFAHETTLKSTSASWKDFRWDISLDKGTLVMIPALATLSSNKSLEETIGPQMETLLRVAGWVHEQQGTPTVAVLTRGAFMTEVDSGSNPLCSSIEAAVRVMANELVMARFRVLDLSLNETDWQIPFLQQELQTSRLNRHETVVALRPRAKYVRRLVSVNIEEEQDAAQRWMPAMGGWYSAERSTDGALDKIIFRQQHAARLGPDDIKIEVHATGLNFKDVMNATGLLDERATIGGLAGQNLGLEVAGRVSEVGDNIHDIQEGDAVLARVSGGLGGSAITNRYLAAPVPSSLSFTQAACVPVAFITAYYSLVDLGRLAAGESVLIHSAAGGVGIAAIQIAKFIGARIYATAGSPERRGFVSTMGVEAVFDSRSNSFHDEVMKETGGKGVDVLLNSLTGTKLSQSIACLAPFGRFLEIGKTDIYRNMRLGLEQFGQNCSFFIIDVDRLAAQEPKLHYRLLNEICNLLDLGELAPLPMSTYSIAELPTAMKDLSRSAVLGKAVIQMPPDTLVKVKAPTELKLRDDRSYLITGGASGLGLQYARLLVDRGARNLILLSRSGPKYTEDYAILADLSRRGATVWMEKKDITNAGAVTCLFERKEWPPIVGVIHCAGILHDSWAHDTKMGDFWSVFKPKALGAWNLSQATQHRHLDFFIMISSISNVLALDGQTSYAAANQFLEGLACHRRASGLSAAAISLGVLGEFGGMSRRSSHIDRVLEIMQAAGMSRMDLPPVLDALEHTILNKTITQTMAVDINWSSFLQAYPHLTADGTFQSLESQTRGPQVSEKDRPVSQLPYSEQVETLTRILRAGIAKIVGVDTERISTQDKIDIYGFDSLMFTQIRSMIMRQLRIQYPLMRLHEGPTLQDIAVELAASFGNGQAEQ